MDLHQVPLELTPWPINGPRRISVNSFGFGGTNVHVILDDARSYLAERGLDGIHCTASSPAVYQNDKFGGDDQGNDHDSDVEDNVWTGGSHISTCTTSRGDESPMALSPSLDIKKHRRGGHQDPSFLRVPSNGSRRSSSDGSRVSSFSSGIGNDSGITAGTRTPSTHSQPSTAYTDEPGESVAKIVFPLSCDDKAVFPEFIDRIIDYLSAEGYHSPGHVRDYAHTLALRSSVFKWRACFIDNSSSGLIHQLREAKVEHLIQAPSQPTGVCFIFGGQGGVWAEMGRDLLCFKPFRESLEAANTFMRTKLRCPFDLFEELERPAGATMIACPFVSQPVTTALQIALVDLVHSFGIVPQYVVGHSSGEIAAAYAASVISSTQAWALAYFRGLHAVKLEREHPHIKGGMMAVGMSAEDAKEYISTSQSVEVACINSPSLVTLSGDRAGINMMTAGMAQKGVFHKVLDIPVAYHSRHMDLIVDAYKASVHKIIPDTPSDGPVMFSSLHGRVADPSELSLDYWAQNLTSQVRFADALRCFETVNAQNRPGMFIEIGPSNGMRRPTLDTITPFYNSSSPPEYLSLLKTGVRGIDVLVGAVGKCWARGVPVKLHEVLEQ